MKILVTGANEYLGLGIVKKLLDDGCGVVATGLAIDECDNRAELKICNLFEVENPCSFFGQPDVILHLAWNDGFIHNADSHINSLSLHHAFLKKIFESDVKSIAIMGSMHEVGFYEGSINENSVCNPMSLYGMAKNALRHDAEYLAKLSGKRLQWLRGYYIVGNTSYGCSVFSKIVQAVEKGKEELPFTMGLNRFDFFDYREFCAQTAVVVQQNKVNGIIDIYNGRPKKLADKVERFIADNSFNIKPQYGAFPDRLYDSKAVWGNNEKISEIMKMY